MERIPKSRLVNYGFILPFFVAMIIFSQEDMAPYMPSIKLNFQYVIVLYTVLIMAFLLIKSTRSILADIVVFLLITRLVLSLTSLINYESNLNEFLYYGYFSVLFTTVIYIYIYNSYNPQDTKFISNMFVLISLILIAQVSIAFVNGIASGISFAYIKSWISIPIGKSNFIAAFLNPILIFLFIYMKKSIYKTILIILLVITTGMTFSDGGLLVLALTFALIYFNKIKNSYVKFLLIILLTLLFLSFLIVPVSSNSEGSAISNENSFFYSYKHTLEQILVQRDLEDASSGRIDIYRYYLIEIKNHSFFGHGFYMPFTKTIANPHNFLISELYTSGIFNLLIYVLVIFLILNKLRHSEDEFITAAYYACIYIIVHSLIEPAILGFNVGFIFWLLMAIAYKRAKLLAG